jgi:predicted metal-binding membrane protein
VVNTSYDYVIRFRLRHVIACFGCCIHVLSIVYTLYDTDYSIHYTLNIAYFLFDNDIMNIEFMSV